MQCERDGGAGSGRGRTDRVGSDRVEWMAGRMGGMKRNVVRTCFSLSSLLMCGGVLMDALYLSYHIIPVAVTTVYCLLFFCILSYNLRYFFIRNLLHLTRCAV